MISGVFLFVSKGFEVFWLFPKRGGHFGAQQKSNPEFALDLRRSEAPATAAESYCSKLSLNSMSGSVLYRSEACVWVLGIGLRLRLRLASLAELNGGCRLTEPQA